MEVPQGMGLRALKVNLRASMPFSNLLVYRRNRLISLLAASIRRKRYYLGGSDKYIFEAACAKVQCSLSGESRAHARLAHFRPSGFAVQTYPATVIITTTIIMIGRLIVTIFARSIATIIIFATIMLAVPAMQQWPRWWLRCCCWRG